jgi:hypothetical protein
MSTWQRDEAGRLRRIEFVVGDLYNNLFEDFENIYLSDTMFNDESKHGKNETLNDSPMKTLCEYLQPTRTSSPSCMVFPTNVDTFDLKRGVIQLLPKFHSLDSENPYLHLKEFEEVCATLHNQNVNSDVVRLKLFPFSFKEKAKNWLNSLKPRSIDTWQEMQREFLKKFFPTH